MLKLRTVIAILLLGISVSSSQFKSTTSQPIIKVFGCSDVNIQTDIRAQVNFYLDRLQLNKDVIIMVTFVDFKPQKHDHEYDLLGTTIPSEFEGKPMMHILLEEDTYYSKQMLILAHEMVHVKQFLTGELIEHPDQHFTWKGKDYYQVQKIYYSSRGWEKEALKQQSQLIQDYKEFRKNNKSLIVRK